MSTEQKAVGTEAYYEKYNIPRVTIANASKVLEQMLIHKIRRGAICLISEAGEGKSQSIRQIARKHGYRVVDLRTAHFSLMGGGIPQKGENGRFQIAVPDYMPKKGEKCILLFDEINQGQSHAISMFFSLLEDRALFDYELPEECIVVAAMNPANAGYQVTKLESLKAFNRRMLKFFVHTPYGDWVTHAKTDEFHYSDGLKKPCHPWILKYLQTNRAAIYMKVEAEKGQQFACPATWQTVSRLMYMLETDKMPLHSEYSRALLGASIGMTTAKGLCDYIENNEVRLDPEDVLSKYKPKSKLREKILELAKSPGGGVPDLMDNLAKHLFDQKPEPATIGPQLALFWSDLASELATSFYTLLSSAAKEGDDGEVAKNRKYMVELTHALMSEECYQEVNTKITAGFRGFAGRLSGGKDATPDPMS